VNVTFRRGMGTAIIAVLGLVLGYADLAGAQQQQQDWVTKVSVQCDGRTPATGIVDLTRDNRVIGSASVSCSQGAKGVGQIKTRERPNDWKIRCVSLGCQSHPPREGEKFPANEVFKNQGSNKVIGLAVFHIGVPEAC